LPFPQFLNNIIKPYLLTLINLLKLLDFITLPASDYFVTVSWAITLKRLQMNDEIFISND